MGLQRGTNSDLCEATTARREKGPWAAAGPAVRSLEEEA